MAYFRCGAKPEEEKTVTAGTSAIVVSPSSGKVMKKVTVNPTPSETKTITPSASQQTVSPSSGKLLSKVTVNGDSNLVAGNIKNGINIFGVTGTMKGGFPNGTEWTQSNVTTGVFWSCYYGNGIWVATSDSGAYYSTDGKIWTLSNLTRATYSVRYDNSMWVVGCLGIAYYSTDGKTWTQATYIHITGSSVKLRCVSFANGRWLISGNSTTIYYSTNGSNWSESNVGSLGFSDFCYTNGCWVATSPNKGLYYSSSGTTSWRPVDSTAATAVNFGNNLWVATGKNTGIRYSVVDPERLPDSWTYSNITDDSLHSVRYADGVWVAGCTSGIYYSDNGKIWTKNSAVNDYINDIYYSCGVWVALGDVYIYYSTDGKTWYACGDSPSGQSQNKQIYNAKGIWVMATKAGLYYSTTWEQTN